MICLLPYSTSYVVTLPQFTVTERRLSGELTLHSLAFDVNVVMKEKQSNTDKGYLFMIVLFGRLYFPSERDDGLIFDIAKLVIGVPKRWLRRTNH